MYTYQKLIDYVNGIGPYWIKLVEQMIPATTIWNGGVKFENSIFNRQKFVYRRQRGDKFVPVEVKPCVIIGNLFDYTCTSEYVDFSIYPWLNGDTSVSNFSGILNKSLNNLLVANGLSATQCILNSIQSTWYLDLKIGDDQIIQVPFYTGYGQTDVPTNTLWKNTLISYLPNLYNYGFTFFLNGNTLRIVNSTCSAKNLNENVVLCAGINIDINCNG
jgi:hypothetical protein